MITASGGHGLRPRSIGEVLDLTFQIYRERFSSFAVLGIATGLLRLILSLAWTVLLFRSIDFPLEDISSIDPERMGGLLIAMLIGLPLFLLALMLISGFSVVAMTAAADDGFFGRPSSLGAVVSKGLARTLPAACVTLLTSILTFAGTCLCCLPGLAALIIWVLAVPLVHLERASITGSMTRSWELVLRRGSTSLSSQSNWVRILVVGLVTFAVYLIMSVIGQLPAAALNVGSILGSREPTMTALGPQPAPLTIMLPLMFVSAAIQGLFIPFLVIPWTIVYYDIRTRYEGLDLEQAASRMGGASGQVDPTRTTSSASEQARTELSPPERGSPTTETDETTGSPPPQEDTEP